MNGTVTKIVRRRGGLLTRVQLGRLALLQSLLADEPWVGASAAQIARAGGIR